MKAKMKKNKHKLAIRERIGITGFSLGLILVIFVVVLLTVLFLQNRNLKSDSLQSLRNTVSITMKPKNIVSLEDNGRIYLANKESDNSDKDNSYKGKGDVLGIVVYKRENGNAIWMKGDSVIYQDIYFSIQNNTVENGSYYEYQKGDFYVGIYSADYFNKNLKLPVELGESDYELPEGSVVYSAIDISDKVSSSKQMTLNLFLVLGVTFLLLIVPVYLASGLIMKPTLDAMKKEKEFVANASHELKTPLAIISASASVLGEKHPEDDTFVNNINQQCANMNETIIDMIDLSKLETKKAVLEEVDVSEMLLDLCLSFDAVAFEHGIDYQYHIDDGLKLEKAERKNLNRLFNLLIDNAMKYTDGDDKKIIIELKKDKKGIFFSIFNTGCEVLDEDREKVFDRFYQGKSGSDKERKGSGLGLAIVHQICERFDYSLKIDSKYHSYMKFEIIMK